MADTSSSCSVTLADIYGCTTNSQDEDDAASLCQQTLAAVGNDAGGLLLLHTDASTASAGSVAIGTLINNGSEAAPDEDENDWGNEDDDDANEAAGTTTTTMCISDLLQTSAQTQDEAAQGMSALMGQCSLLTPDAVSTEAGVQQVNHQVQDDVIHEGDENDDEGKKEGCQCGVGECQGCTTPGCAADDTAKCAEEGCTADEHAPHSPTLDQEFAAFEEQMASMMLMPSNLDESNDPDHVLPQTTKDGFKDDVVGINDTLHSTYAELHSAASPDLVHRMRLAMKDMPEVRPAFMCTYIPAKC